MKFADETTEVLIGGCLSMDAGHDDYEVVGARGDYLRGGWSSAKTFTETCLR